MPGVWPAIPIQPGPAGGPCPSARVQPTLEIAVDICTDGQDGTATSSSLLAYLRAAILDGFSVSLGGLLICFTSPYCALRPNQGLGSGIVSSMRRCQREPCCASSPRPERWPAIVVHWADNLPCLHVCVGGLCAYYVFAYLYCALKPQTLLLLPVFGSISNPALLCPALHCMRDTLPTIRTTIPSLTHQCYGGVCGCLILGRLSIGCSQAWYPHSERGSFLLWGVWLGSLSAPIYLLLLPFHLFTSSSSRLPCLTRHPPFFACASVYKTSILWRRPFATLQNMH
jgi:hypothetical protein